MTHSHKQQDTPQMSDSWESEFDEQFPYIDGNGDFDELEPVKSFIRKTLAHNLERIKEERIWELRGMKRKLSQLKYNMDCRLPRKMPPVEGNMEIHEWIAESYIAGLESAERLIDEDLINKDKEIR